ncbi:hypothetical protein [Methylobacterium sp. WSM2598]|uniref:hypothetical protein n=1 Tax=Methylobacterium sp. WSM2598 TaxID=398261 RepID=UPI0003710664|nr:hypothetical protein [Methylobacterium sp. WSM2598]
MSRRNPRRAYDEQGRAIPPPTIGWIRSEEGDRTAFVHANATQCGHEAVISTDCFPDSLPFPDIALHPRCSACGAKSVGVMCDVVGIHRRLQAHRVEHGQRGDQAAGDRVTGRDTPWPDKSGSRI